MVSGEREVRGAVVTGGPGDLRVHHLEELLDQASDLLPHCQEFRARYLDVVVDEQDADTSAWRRDVALQDDLLHLYVFGEVGHDTAVKIGIARRTGGRLAALNAGNPRRLEFLYESFVPTPAGWSTNSTRFSSHGACATNGEWFNVRPLLGDGGDWGGLIDRALHGDIPGAAPSPVPAPVGEHGLLHVEGLPRALTACCTLRLAERGGRDGSRPQRLSTPHAAGRPVSRRCSRVAPSSGPL